MQERRGIKGGVEGRETGNYRSKISREYIYRWADFVVIVISLLTNPSISPNELCELR